MRSQSFLLESALLLLLVPLLVAALALLLAPRSPTNHMQAAQQLTSSRQALSLCEPPRDFTPSTDPIAAVIGRVVEPSTIRLVREYLARHGLRLNATPASVWSLVAWVEEHIAYSESRAKLVAESSTLIPAWPPLVTLSRGEGICTDIAVLLADALLAAGFPHAYILALRGCEHAAAAVVLDGYAFVLERELPPVNLQDYVQYVLPCAATDTVTVVVAPGRWRACRGLALPLADDYPLDWPPSSFASEVAGELAHRSGVVHSKWLDLLAEWGYYGVTVDLYYEVEAPGAPRAPLLALYSPLFAEQWPGLVASMLTHYIPRSARQVGAALVRPSGVRLAYTPLDTRGSASCSGGACKLTVVGVDCSSIAINVYEWASGRLVAGVAPRGYEYPQLTTIPATAWSCSGSRLAASFSTESLPPGEYIVLVWSRGWPAYAFKLRVG